MKKDGSLSRRKNTFEKKKGLYRVLLGHPSFGLTRRVYQFTPRQLQARILNEIDLTKAPGHPSPRLTRRARPGGAGQL